MTSSKRRRQGAIGIVVVCLLLTLSSGVVAAAVSGSFSATYDGYGDESTEAPGHEIAIDGQLEVTGDPAVNPTVVITASDTTVLDTESVRVFVEGDRSINFEQTYRAGEVRLTADEIPSGTTIRVEYRTYYIGNAESDSVTAGEVEVNYDRPGGERVRESFQAETTLENRPEDLLTTINSSEQQSTVQQLLSYIGAGSVVLLFIVLIYRVVSGGDGGPPSPGPGP